MWDQATWFGGALGQSISANYIIVNRRNRVFTFNPSGALSVTLPDATKLWLGWGLYLIVNEHASNVLTVKDKAGGTVATLAGREAVLLGLSAKDTLAGTWTGVKSTV